MDHFLQQLPPSWTDVIEGFEKSNFFEHVDVLTACPTLAHGRWPWILDQPEGEERTRETVNYVKELKKQYDQFHHYFPNKIDSIVWSFKDEDEEDVSWNVSFVCTLKECEYPYAYFEASIGSCGYTNCEVGGAYGVFYLGTLDDIVKYAMDDKTRELFYRETP